MTRPLFSLVSTFRNVAPFIRQHLDSIRAQSFRDFEVLLMDDCSDDGTWEIVQQYAAEDSMFRAIQSPERRWALANKLDGIQQARGEIIVSVDGDDMLAHPMALARVKAAYDRDPETDATYGSWQAFPDGYVAQIPLIPNGHPWWSSPWNFSHVLTFRRSLSVFSQQKEPESYIDPLIGSHYRLAWDVPMFFGAIARARKVAHIADVIYLYRRHALNDDATDRPGQEAAEKRARAWWCEWFWAQGE